MHNSYRSDDRRAGPTRATLRSGFHGPLPVLYRFGGLIMTIASLKWSQKATATRETKALGFSGIYERYLASQAGLADDAKAYRAVVEAESARTAVVAETAAVEE